MYFATSFSSFLMFRQHVQTQDITLVQISSKSCLLENKKRIKIARRDKKENDGRKKGQEKMP